MMGANRRQGERIRFELGYAASIVAIDATWHRDCSIEDISKSGAKLAVNGSIVGLALDEFFLVLSRTGHPHRRCKLAWINGEQIGVRFLHDVAPPNERRGGTRPARALAKSE